MGAADSSHETNSDQTPIVASTAEQSYGTYDVEMGSARDKTSSLFDVTRLLRIAVIALSFTSLLFYFIGNEYTRILNLLAGVTALTFFWNLCIVIVTIYSLQNWKRYSDGDEPRKLYQQLVPLNDAWLSGYIFMFTLWAKLLHSDQKNGQRRYKVDAVFILNCTIL